MFPAPSPSPVGRGEVVLQPNYFTSSVYVKAFRDDFSTLILKYHEAYSQAASVKPFALFKTVWMTMGWHWLHFKVFDNRSRLTFLEVTLRLFLERTVKTEAPFTRVVALFSTYTFFYTQVESPVPPLQIVGNIPIPYDHYQSLTKLADTLTSQQCVALCPHVRYILSCMQKDKLFLILPRSELGPMNPRDLPREIYAADGIVFSDLSQKRKGRPAKKDKVKKARLALDELNELVSKPEGSTADIVDEMLIGYQSAKSSLLKSGSFSLNEINHAVLDGLKKVQETISNDMEPEGIQRVQRAIAEDAERGILRLLE